MEILVLSRRNAMNAPLQVVPYAHISIRGVGGLPLQLPPDPCCVGTLFLEFDDVEDEESGFTPISDAQAREIWAFVQSVRERAQVLICQCEAGVSRSAGAAAAIAEVLTGDGARFFDDPRYFPNRLVYRKVLQAACGEPAPVRCSAPA